jgi:hypothetical protein
VDSACGSCFFGGHGLWAAVTRLKVGEDDVKRGPGVPFLVMGIAFISLGISGQRAFIAIGGAFLALGAALMFRRRRVGGSK